MNRKSRLDRTAAWSAALLLVANASAHAAEPRAGTRRPPSSSSPAALTREGRIPAAGAPVSEVRSTQLDIEIIADRTGTGLEAQEWARVFATLGRSVRLRYDAEDTDPEISESSRGPLRTVKIVGRLDRSGQLEFPGRSFGAGEDRALREWLDERETYGAQGSPEGHPNWGLNRDQFTRLFTALAVSIDDQASDRPLLEIAEQYGLTRDLGFRIHSSAQDIWRGEGTPLKARQEIRGLTLGTGFAVLLADHGLCMRPQRNPKGDVELVVQRRTEITDPWPVGWEPKSDVPRSEIVPELFAFRPIGFLDRPLIETLDAAEAETGTVIAVDFWKAREKNIDLANFRYRLPRAKTAWVLVIRSAIGKSQMQPQFRADELGRGFLWVTPLDPRAAGK